MLPTNFQSLGDMFTSGNQTYSIAPTLMGLEREKIIRGNIEQARQAEAAKQAYEAELNPLKIRNERLQGDIRQQELDLATKVNPLKVEEATNLAGRQRYLQMKEFGDVALQIGSMAEQNGGNLPLEWLEAMPKEFTTILKEPGGAARLKAIGESAVINSAKWLAQQSKQASAEDVAAEKLRSAENRAREDRLSRERIAASRLDSARKLAADKRATSSDKKTLEQYAQDLLRAANEIELDNPEAARVLMGRYQKALADAQKLKSAGATVGDEFKRELLKLPGRYTNQPPAQAAPAATAPADPYAGFKIK